MSDRANQLISRHPAPDPRGDRRERRHLRGVPGRQAVVHRRRRGGRVAAVRRRLHRARRRGAGVRQPRRLPGHDPRPVPPPGRAAARRAVRAARTAPTSPATARVVSGRVTDVDGNPLADANLDIWQADAEGRYSGFMPGPPEGNLRGQVRTDADGRYEFVTVIPGPYTIPLDGPTGKMTAAAGWSPWRPAHIHLIVSAEGYEPLVTQLFIDTSDYLDNDVASAVKPELIVHPEPTGDGELAFTLRLRARPRAHAGDRLDDGRSRSPSSAAGSAGWSSRSPCASAGSAATSTSRRTSCARSAPRSRCRPTARASCGASGSASRSRPSRSSRRRS